MRLIEHTPKKGIMTIKAIAIFAVLTCLMAELNAQSVFDREALLVNTKEESAFVSGITNFIVTALGNKVLVEFTVVGETEKCTFFLERSVNGTDWLVIAQKKGIASSDPNKAVTYTFVDNKPLQEPCYYKIMQLKENGVVYSDVWNLDYNGGKEPMLTQKKEEE